ncbi:MAG: succinate dehydrogenase assembly factor 2 [Zoogloeaceae bacterium]|jgi:succinate dehydrogenase flavin-adding protein (antitoxin of CptAB toxin-antitoxin module)|nr:succinate dehydrogenase assembly factor 2 [Zoogloeaceae bacterium]
MASLDTAALSRLRWRCTRRAMLEMDLLLGEFLEKEFSSLAPEEQAAFVELADCEDMKLWPWISGREACEDTRLASVVVMLRRRLDGAHTRDGAA